MFYQCYRPRVDGMSGRAWFERVALPIAGGVEDQPAKLLRMMAVVERTANDEMTYSARLHRRNKARQRERDAREKERQAEQRLLGNG